MIRLDGVSKRYADGTVAVHRLALEVAPGQLVVLVGPSGCGKSTTLKMVNRLIEPTEGRILLEGEDVTKVDPVHLRRRMGYVIQQVGLFPHQSVAANIATVPRLLGWKKRRIDARVDELLNLVGLDPERYARRYPHQLSGGQRQRVGVARALAADPPVLLMDEPFGAVDPVVRERLQSEFLRLQREVRKTILFVTHDIDEAVRLGDRIAVFSPVGRIEQYAVPAAVLGAPSSDYVADFVGGDREVKRLSVTPIDVGVLDHPPSVSPDASLGHAADVLGASEWSWAAVVDEHGHLRGWIGAEDTRGRGTVSARARTVPACVHVGESLRCALATLLAQDTGWVAVLDERRFVGILSPAALHAALRKARP